MSFRPDWASAPGETIADILKERQLSVIDFAARLGQTSDAVADLLQGRSTITIRTARALQLVLGASVDFWMSRDFQYREAIAQRRATNSSPWQKPPLHSPGDPSRLTALFLGRIWPLCALVPPCSGRARDCHDRVSVRRGVSTTDCWQAREDGPRHLHRRHVCPNERGQSILSIRTLTRRLQSRPIFHSKLCTDRLLYPHRNPVSIEVPLSSH